MLRVCLENMTEANTRSAGQRVSMDDHLFMCLTEEAGGERVRAAVRVTSTKLVSQLSVGHRLDSLCGVASEPRLALEAAKQRAVDASLLEPRLCPRVTARHCAQHGRVTARAPDTRPLHTQS